MLYCILLYMIHFMYESQKIIPTETLKTIFQAKYLFYDISDQEMGKRKRTSKAQTDGVIENNRSFSSDTSDDSDSKKHSSGHNSGK